MCKHRTTHLTAKARRARTAMLREQAERHELASITLEVSGHVAAAAIKAKLAIECRQAMAALADQADEQSGHLFLFPTGVAA